MSNQPTFLAPAAFIDSDHPSVVAFAKDAVAGVNRERDRAVRLYQAVRDFITYDPYVNFGDPANFRASGVLTAKRGFCVGKAALLAACARAVGIPARVGFADVRNHMTSRRLHDLVKTDVFRWHSYSDLLVEGSWAKATPAFDSVLCQRVGIKPLDYDGRTDSLFHPFDGQGRRHMEYLLDRGTYEDVPFAVILDDFREHYPALVARTEFTGDFASEAYAGDKGGAAHS